MRVYIDSPSMGHVQVVVLLPRDRSKPRPTVYLLDGRSAFQGGNNWITQGHALQFFDDKPVNVVITTGGTASYYTDWQHPDPTLGNYKWETFLTHELPPLIDARFHGNGTNGLVGLSMGAQSAMMLAIRAPDRYRAIAAFSGCYTSDGFGEAQMRAVIASYGGRADNMFGAAGSPDWKAHDVLSHADALRGKTLYISSGSGRAGPHETPDVFGLPERIIIGGALEAAVNRCTHEFVDRLTALGIPATANFHSGTHSWPYWADDLVSSWPTLAAGLGV